MTGLDFIKGALEILGSYTPEEGVSDSDGDTCLKFLIAMLDTWSSELGAIYAVTTEQFSLTSDTIDYTMGPTGDFVTTRPLSIIKAKLRDNQDVDHDLDLQPFPEYEDIMLKDTGGALSWVLGYNMTNPDVSLKLYPPSDSSYKLRLTTYKALATAVLASEYAVPPGYNNAIMWNLAAEVAHIFGKGKAIGSPANPKSIAGRAVALYDGLILSNLEPTAVEQDPTLPGGDHILRSWKFN